MTKELESRIGDALGDTNADSTAIANLLEQCSDAIKQSDADVEHQREISMDPSLSPDISAARSAMEDCIFQANRLRTLQPRLERRLREVTERAEADAWRERYDALKPRRDSLAEELTQVATIVPERGKHTGYAIVQPVALLCPTRSW